MADSPWEDSLLERKLESDLKDLLKTMVGFANSLRPRHIATILIGEKNDGSVQGIKDADNIQKEIRKTAEKIYPPILWRSQVYEKKGMTCLRVEIEYDGETPHFGGAAWVRKGSETKLASDEIFQRLIEFRTSKIRELAQWIEKEITVAADLGIPVKHDPEKIFVYESHPRWNHSNDTAVLCLVNQFYVTLEIDGKRTSEPLEKIIISWDNERNRLKILVKV